MHEIGDGSKRGEYRYLMPSRDFHAAKRQAVNGKFTINAGQNAILPRNFSATFAEPPTVGMEPGINMNATDLDRSNP